MEYDVIIIGAGPAGLMLAHKLKDSKLKVLLIEKRNTTKKLDNNIFITFKDTLKKFKLKKSIINKISRVQLYGPQNSVKFNFWTKPLAVINLDRWAQSLELNCEIKTNTTIAECKRTKNKISVQDTKGKNFSAKIIADCSGFSQITTKSLKNQKGSIYYNCYGLILENCKIPEPKEASLNADFKFTNAGGWLYPFSKNKCQVGLGDFLPYKTNYKKPLKQRTLQMIKKFEPYKTWLKDARIISEVYKKAPIIMPNSNMIQDNLILIGDAAGHSTPFLGEGIRPAFEMAETTSKVIMNSFKKNDFSKESLQEYEKIWMEKFGRKYPWSILIRHIWAHEFSNKDIGHLIPNIQKLPKRKFYNFLRGNIDAKLLYNLINFKIIDDVVKNFFKRHLSNFNPEL